MSQQPTRLDPNESLGYQVRSCHRRFDRLLNAYLSPYEIGSGFWYYLRVLWRRDGLTQRALSDETNVAENSTVVTITAMAKRGLVDRIRDGVDRRKIRIILSDKARKLEPTLLPVAARINNIATAGIDPNEVAICLSVLRRVAENLDQARLDLGLARADGGLPPLT